MHRLQSLIRSSMAVRRSSRDRIRLDRYDGDGALNLISFFFMLAYQKQERRAFERYDSKRLLKKRAQLTVSGLLFDFYSLVFRQFLLK